MSSNQTALADQRVTVVEEATISEKPLASSNTRSPKSVATVYYASAEKTSVACINFDIDGSVTVTEIESNGQPIASFIDAMAANAGIHNSIKSGSATIYTSAISFETLVYLVTEWMLKTTSEIYELGDKRIQRIEIVYDDMKTLKDILLVLVEDAKARKILDYYYILSLQFIYASYLPMSKNVATLLREILTKLPLGMNNIESVRQYIYQLGVKNYEQAD